MVVSKFFKTLFQHNKKYIEYVWLLLLVIKTLFSLYLNINILALNRVIHSSNLVTLERVEFECSSLDKQHIF